MKTNRDLSIERLLRRPVQTQEPVSGACPDAEALAALADDSLSAVERQGVEAHVADCHRCQALTAAMVRTAEKGVGPTPFWRRRRMLTWLIPATAAATAVALWVAVPGQRLPAPEERQAEFEAPTAPPAEPANAPAADALGPSLRDRADDPARSKTDTALGSASGDARLAAPSESLVEQDQNRLAREERGASEQKRIVSEPDRSLLDRSAPLASARAAAQAAADFEVVVSSDPLVRWRIDPGGVVQYSNDGGVTWARQETGAATPLTAGDSPSPSVCWLVGRGGLVLRSVDGGRQWLRVMFPEAVDLVAVSASNALTATVDLADGRRLGTTDGGQTWSDVPK